MPSATIFVPWLYYAVPVVAAAIAALRAWRGRTYLPFRELAGTFIGGAVGGLMLALVYLLYLHSDVRAEQIVITCYWGIAVACVLRGFGLALAWTTTRSPILGSDGRFYYPAPPVLISLFRAVVLLAVSVPYVGAMVVSYRPRSVHSGTPVTLLGMEYQDVAFSATDGVKLRGWWIPTAHTSQTDDRNPLPAWGERTIIVCHGFGADKASQLRLVRDLAPNGYNILAFDFRAHGQSGGHLTTFGDLERRDVLGAVRWVRENHPAESRKIFGVGESLGAAALIGAAADPSPEGQAIDALALFAPYDRLSAVIQDTADESYISSAGWMATHLALPVAGAQLGTPLGHFSPAGEIDKIAPRPILVIATDQDRQIDSNRSRELYEQASQPKYGYWVKKQSRHLMLFGSERSSVALRIFFGTAREIL